MLNVVVFGASSPFVISLLKELNLSFGIAHAFLHSKTVKEIQQVLLKTKLSCPVEILDGDFTNLKKTFLADCEDRLKRLPAVDLIIWSTGIWHPHVNLEHACLSTHFTQWQGNFFTPLALLKILLNSVEKKTVFLYNNFSNALQKKSLHSLTQPSLNAFLDLVEIAAEEKKFHLIKTNLPLYQSNESAKVFTNLPALSPEDIHKLKVQLYNYFSLSLKI